jgi:imidazoleglycerol phosphate dehydratase HisB
MSSHAIIRTSNSTMEQLIFELTGPANQGSRDVALIQKQIQQLQREKSAWQLGLDFLQHNESVIRFYGALTLTIKINADWSAYSFHSICKAG